jgi:glycosyltransferase involved in cell wall biosynthesis
MANILLELVGNTEKRNLLAQQARHHIVDNFSIESMVNNYESTYQALIQPQASA